MSKFLQQFQQTPSNPMMETLLLVNALAGNSPSQVVQNLMKTSPQFARLANEVQGKTPEQAFSERGLDFGTIKMLMSKF